MLSKMERNRLKNFLADRYNSSIALKIINYLKIPQNFTLEEFLNSAQQFFKMKRIQLMELAFQVHDNNNDGAVDINDAYDLMFAGKLLRTEADYLI
jgi:Ca2+-binding EF-hand superfamily protein